MTKLGEVCKHGGLRRMCETCDLAERLDTAVSDFADACHEIKELRSKLDTIRRACGGAVTHPIGAGLYASGFRDSAARILNLMDPLPEAPNASP